MQQQYWSYKHAKADWMSDSIPIDADLPRPATLGGEQLTILVYLVWPRHVALEMDRVQAGPIAKALRHQWL